MHLRGLKMKRSFICSLLITVLTFSFIYADNTGLNLIKKGQFQSAVSYYESDSLHLNPSDLNNLGFAYYKIGSLSRAILYTNRALKLKPDYKDAYNNLKFYRSRLPNDFQQLKSIHLFNFIVRNISINMLIVLSLIGILFLIALILFKIRYNIVFVIVILIFEFFTNGAIISIKQNENKSYGVIIKSCDILEGAGSEFISKAKAPEGAEFYLMDKQDGYYHVRFLNGIEGWIAKSDSQLI